MRRPAPLPAPAEKVAEPGGGTAPARARREPTPIVRADLAEPAGGVEPELVAESPAPTSSRDVWRAARARRKALRAEIRRFTQRSRRRRMVWLGVVGAVVLLVGGSLIAAYSPLFAVQKITVVGTSALDPAAVETALEGQLGTPLALVDAGEVKAALQAFPLIETYALEARPPHDLTVRIVERTPVGVLASDAGYTLVDAAGVALATTPAQPEGQPVLDISGGAESSAFRSAGLVVRSLPADVRGRLTSVTASSADDVTLRLDERISVVWGSAEDSAEKARVLMAIMAANPDARSFDISSPSIAVVG